MASDVSSLNDLAQDVLTVAGTCLTTTDAGLPSLHYVSPAAPAFDCCPALIVNVAGLGEEPTSPLAPLDVGRRASYGRINAAAFIVWALRCAPEVRKDGTVLTADIEAVALQVNQDAWALWTGFYNAVRTGSFKDKCSEVHFDRGLPIAEQGGCVGWQFVVRTELDGIPLP